MSEHYKFGDVHRKLVEQWAAVGLSKQAMCDLLTKHAKLAGPIHIPTLEKHFKIELATGAASANAAVAGALFKKAIDGNVDAAKFWLDRRGGKEWEAGKDVDDGSFQSILKRYGKL